MTIAALFCNNRYPTYPYWKNKRPLLVSKNKRHLLVTIDDLPVVHIMVVILTFHLNLSNMFRFKPFSFR